MSFYARKMLNRPGVTFGSQRSRQSREDGRGVGDNDPASGGNDDHRGGGISRFSHHPRQQQQQQRHRQALPMFEEVPIEGSIHAHEDDMRNFSQVTLSQLSDGPSVRSMKSYRSSSQRSSGAGGVGVGGARGNSNGGEGIAALGMNHRLSGGIGGKKQSGSRGSGGYGMGMQMQLSQSRHGIGSRGREQQRSSRTQEQGMRSREEDDNRSMKSSQPLLSQRPSSITMNRPNSSSSGPIGSRPSSSGSRQLSQSRMPSSSRPSSRGGGEQRQDSRIQHHEDDNSTIQSQSLLSAALPESKALPSQRSMMLPPRRLENNTTQRMLRREGTAVAASNNKQSQFRTPPTAGNAHPSYSGRNRASSTLASKKMPHPPLSSSGRTALRTMGAISGTLASLPTPTKAFRSMSSLAVKTTASLLTPFRQGRVRSLASSALTGSSTLTGSTLAGPRLGSSTTAPRSTLGSSLFAPSSSMSRLQRDLSAGKTDHSRILNDRKATMAPNDCKRPTTSDRHVDAQAKEASKSPIAPVADSSKSHTSGGNLGVFAEDSAPMITEKVADHRSAIEDADSGHTRDSGDTLDNDQSTNSSAKMADQRPDVEDTREPAAKDTSKGPTRGTEPMAIENTNDHCGDKPEAGATSNKGPRDVLTMKSNVELPQENQQSMSPKSAPTSLSNRDVVMADSSSDKHQDEDDAMSKTSGCTLDIHGKAEELIAATRELKHQHELLEKSKQEFIEMNERARHEWKAEYHKLETLQRSTQDQFGTLQGSMDAFSTKIASSAHDQELAIRTLVSTFMNQLRQERSSAMGSISNQASEMKAQLPLEVRAMVEAEAKAYMSGLMDEMMAKAKADFQEWADGVKSGSVGTLSSERTVSISTERSNAAIGVCTKVNVSGVDVNATENLDRVDTQSVLGHTGSFEYQTRSDGEAGISSPEKENVEPCPVVGDQCELASCDSESIASDHVDDDGNGSPLRENRAALSPLPRDSMSTATTPFSRKTTPLMKNSLSKSSTRSQHQIDLEAELRNDFSIVKSPLSSQKRGLTVSNNNAANIQQTATPIRNAKGKAIKKALSTETKYRVKAPKQHALKETRSSGGLSKGIREKESEQILGISSKPKMDVSDHNTGLSKIHKIRRCNQGPPKKPSRKRGQSAMRSTAKSPRRSKRVKEANRVEQMAILSDIEAKPMKVTPKEDKTPKVNSCEYDVSDEPSPIDCGSPLCSADGKGADSVSAEGYDSLLGTSVTVPTDDRCKTDDIGLDESEDVQPDRRSLSSLLPFAGFRNRNKAKTMSKKKKKNVSSTFDFDFS